MRLGMGVIGAGPARYKILNTLSWSSDTAGISTLLGIDNSWYLSAFAADTARPRPLLLSFAGRAVDRAVYNGISVYPKDETVDGSTTFVEWLAGSTTGVKLRVHSPASGTVVETFDNLATTAAIAAVNSNYVKLFAFASPTTLPTTGGAAAAIGRAYKDAVTACVAAMSSQITRFEGPINEPYGSQSPTWTGAETAHAMRLFNQAVKAGRSGAIVVGPNPVEATVTATVSGGWFDQFLASGGGTWCDEISFHPYDLVVGDLGAARRQWTSLVACLTRYGQQNKPLWDTEHSSFPDVNGATGNLHPRSARYWMLDYLLFEQYGIPKERCTVFHDMSTGDWQHPWFMFESQASYYGNSSSNAIPALIRTFAEEVWGRSFTSAFDFGTVGNDIYLGNLYTAGDGSKMAAFMATCPQLNGKVTLTVSGASSLTAVDAWGATSTVPVASGRLVLPVGELPVYLRIPAGVTVTLYSFGDWPALASPSVGTDRLQFFSRTPIASNGVTQSALAIGDGAYYWQSPYIDNGPAPCTIGLNLNRAAYVDRVLIWSGAVWNPKCALTDFDVQTSIDGSTWTTRATVTRPTPASFFHGHDSGTSGMTRVDYWERMWIFDVKLPAKVAASYVRLNIRSASYGYEVDAAALAVGQGNSARMPYIQRLAVFCDDTATPRYVTLS